MNCCKQIKKAFYALQRLVDKIKGVDFVSETETGRHENHVRYAASTPLVIHVLNSYFSSRKIGEKDAIIDVGCGKGRMLAFFARYPFGKVGGIEYNEGLV